MGVHTPGQYFSGAGYDGVVGASEARDRVEQDHHVAFVLYQTLGLLDHHVGDLHVARGRLIKGGGDDFGTARAHRALHLGHFFRSLVDKQDDHVALGVVGDNRLRNVLHHDRLTGLGRCDEQSTLSLANRRHEVNQATRQVLGRAVTFLEG